MAITRSEIKYILVIILIGGFATMVINSLFKVNNLWLGIAGLLLVAYKFKLN
jgi:hypothetical protein